MYVHIEMVEIYNKKSFLWEKVSIIYQCFNYSIHIYFFFSLCFCFFFRILSLKFPERKLTFNKCYFHLIIEIKKKWKMNKINAKKKSCATTWKTISYCISIKFETALKAQWTMVTKHWNAKTPNFQKSE